MTTPLVLFVIVLLLPLFAASWRTSLVGLSAQGFLMAWLVYDRAPAIDVAQAIALVDLALVRAIAVPLVLYRVLRAKGVARRNDVIPPNLLSWTAVLVLVLLAFRFAAAMPMPEPERPFAGVATAALLLAFFVLGTQVGVFSQIVGVFRIENAIAMLALGFGDEPGWGVQLAELAVLGLTLVLCRWYLIGLVPAAPPPAEDVP